ncbi:ranBP-type and C3HC4-type zinc finger-containing protein 1-like [Armigeres subalbatus]|uniref:ranBP-type and C3HC4-type zinc finger-containing protein 1-like n=1 Tax=Armigeres subalbatus TaxID=124917 RepID=UPI002ED573E4
MSCQENEEEAEIIESLNNGIDFIEEPFECSTCFILTGPTGVFLLDCAHCFCINCVTDLFIGTDDEIITCPSQVNNATCNTTVFRTDVENLLGEEIYNAYRESKRSEDHMQAMIDHLKLMELSDANIVPNNEPFECPVCITDIAKDQGVLLRDCFHSFCRECLSRTVIHAESVIVRCPAMVNNESCETIIRDPEIKCLLSEVDYEAYLSRSLRTAEASNIKSVHCKTPDCIFWCELMDNATSFDCPVCRKVNCVKCKVIHDGITCKDYRNKLVQDKANSISEEELEKQRAAGTVMRCPKCSVWVTKTAGCDFMRCSICKTAICWATRGPRWGPAGDGDNSGGCGCQISKRCTPTCGGCHF